MTIKSQRIDCHEIKRNKKQIRNSRTEIVHFRAYHQVLSVPTGARDAAIIEGKTRG